MGARKEPINVAWKVLVMNSDNQAEGGQAVKASANDDCEDLIQNATRPARPAFHFTPPFGWMNDPNGLVFYRGEYHLFYQHNPHGSDFGPMHWGHAATRDFVNWHHFPTALHPDENGLIYSGSIVVDWNNTSGFGDTGNPPLVALYTYHHADRERDGHGDHQTQALAYSLDGGVSWVKYSGNPVLGNDKKQHDFRDPKVFWHDASSRWIKLLAVGDHVAFFSSPDLKKWAYASAFAHGVDGAGGVWECPDLFALKTPEGGEKWVLIVSVNPGGPQGGSGTQYFIGDFDGSEFSLDTEFSKTLSKKGTAWLDWGSDNYAGVTWSDVPDADGRRLLIGWMSNWKYAKDVPASTWRGAMTIPRELSLCRIDDTLVLASNPVREAIQRMENIHASPDMCAITAEGVTTAFEPGEITLNAQLFETSQSIIGVELRNRNGESTRIGFNTGPNEFFCEHQGGDDTVLARLKSEHLRGMPRLSQTRDLQMRILIDQNSVELFADGGVGAFTESFFPNDGYDEIRVFADGAIKETATFQIKRLVSNG